MSQTPERHSRGFTLVELLVAIALGILVLLALTIVFARNSGNHSELERTTRQIEGARFSLDMLREDLMHAGYFGDFNPNTLLPNLPAYQTPDPCATAVTAQGWDTTVLPVQIPVGIQGIGAGTALVGCAGNRRAGTEAVVVRHAETGAPSATLASAVASNLYIQIARCSTQIPLTPISAAAGQSAALNLQLPDCATVNPIIRRLSQRTYFIATCNQCAPSDGIPTLKRVEMINGALREMSVAEGVENLQLEYGLDTTVPGDGIPDTFVTAAGVTGVAPNLWQNVVAVRVHLLTRSTEVTPGFTDERTYVVGPNVSVVKPSDGFKRTLLTSSVRLNNVGGRRE